jgi:hypothetical protein
MTVPSSEDVHYEKLLGYRPVAVDKFPFFIDSPPTFEVEQPFLEESEFNTRKELFYLNPPHTVCFWSKDDLK